MNLICLFSKYKNALGEAGKGLHQYRFLNTAIVDYILSILFAMLITFFTQIPLVLTTISVLLLGLFLHMLFGVETDAIKYLGLTC